MVCFDVVVVLLVVGDGEICILVQLWVDVVVDFLMGVYFLGYFELFFGVVDCLFVVLVFVVVMVLVMMFFGFDELFVIFEGYGFIDVQMVCWFVVGVLLFQCILMYLIIGILFDIDCFSYWVFVDFKCWIELCDEYCIFFGCGCLVKCCDFDYCMVWEYGGLIFVVNLVYFC